MQPIFLFSLPRSGSTLAQRIIASHAEIVTTAEPWILLPCLYALRHGGVYAEYSQAAAVKAIRDFCEIMPNGENDYLEETRLYIERLYKRAAKDDKKFFLDKTPRYHLVVDDIFRVFPDAKFIFLWRNPLSIIASIVQSFLEGRWKLHRYKVDLFTGLENLVAAYERNAHRACVLRYEDLVKDPMAEWERICTYLDLPKGGKVIDDLSKSPKLEGRMGDKVGTRHYTTVSLEPLKKWETVITNPVRKAWCRRYIRWIGKERLTLMGYDMDQLLADLEAVPTRFRFVGADLVRMIYGAGICVLQPRILADNLRKLPAWKSVVPYT